MAKKFNFYILDIEDTKMTGNKTHDLTRPRKGFALSFNILCSSSKDKSLVFEAETGIEVDDSAEFLLKNKSVISYYDFRRLFESDFISKPISGTRNRHLSLVSFPTLRLLYKKIKDCETSFSINIGDCFSKSNFYEFYLKIGFLKRNNYTIVCDGKYIPVVNDKLLLNCDEDNQIACFNNEVDLNKFIIKQIYSKHSSITKERSYFQFGYDYFMAYFNRIDFDKYLKISPEPKLVCITEYEDKTTNKEVYSITCPDDLLEIIDTTFYIKNTYFTNSVIPFNIDDILLNSTIYKWEDEYGTGSFSYINFITNFFKHICDTLIPS